MPVVRSVTRGWGVCMPAVRSVTRGGGGGVHASGTKRDKGVGV